MRKTSPLPDVMRNFSKLYVFETDLGFALMHSHGGPFCRTAQLQPLTTTLTHRRDSRLAPLLILGEGRLLGEGRQALNPSTYPRRGQARVASAGEVSATFVFLSATKNPGSGIPGSIRYAQGDGTASLSDTFPFSDEPGDFVPSANDSVT
jgi:hypothetical protein